MKKIMILGFSGSGKSTLAMRLGKILNIEPIHFDRIHWLPGWVESTVRYKEEIIASVLSRDKWIMDGNYRSVLWKERLNDADTIIFIDRNRFKCFSRALKRSRDYKGKTRPDMGEGCTEKFDFEFAKWILWDGRKNRKKILSVLESVRDRKDIYILKTDKDIDRFIGGIQK